MSRVWFITGCSTGFGRRLAESLLQRGERVVATARDVRSLDDLDGSGDALVRLPLDVTRGAHIRSAAEAAFDRFGQVDVLVNNAGYGYFSIQEEGDIDEIRRMFETNVFGLMRVTQAFLPSMRERRSGVIMNVSSIAGRVSFPRSGFYNASKSAVEAWSESLHLETHPFGIRIVLIEPGAYDTDFGPRSAVRSESLTDADSPYASYAQAWSDAAGKMMPQKQNPMEVVDGMMLVADGDEPFVRIPFGKDANALIDERASRSDAEFVRSMRERYYGR